MGLLDLFRSTKPLEEDLDNVKKATFQSFSNVKRDIGALSGWIAFLQKADEEKNLRLERIEQQLQKIYRELDNIEFIDPVPKALPKEILHQKEQTQQEETIAHFDLYKKLESLTFQQRNLFNLLCKIGIESGNEWKSMTDISQDVYGNKPYGQVRTTLSAYSARLEELSLVERTRKGRFVYIRLTSTVIEGLKGGEVKLVDHLPA